MRVMTGRHSDETADYPQEHHSDAESLRRVPVRESGVVQDSPGTGGDTVEQGAPGAQGSGSADGTIGGTLNDDLSARS